jgi:NAD-reducing hydrogenase small subunit
MRNEFKLKDVLTRAYVEHADVNPGPPVFGHETVPALLHRARPIHEFVPVEYFVPGCPPPPEAIFHVISELLAGRTPDPGAWTRFGR